MWMLHDYSMTLSSSQMVYVNVTWLFYDFIKFSNCLCECYMIILWLYQVLELFMWMLHDYSMTLSSSQIVYVIVTYDNSLALSSSWIVYVNVTWLLYDLSSSRIVYVNVTW
jgi:hypothetical protein